MMKERGLYALGGLVVTVLTFIGCVFLVMLAIVLQGDGFSCYAEETCGTLTRFFRDAAPWPLVAIGTISIAVGLAVASRRP